MPGLLRAVLDTNVLLAARLSSHPASPNLEVFDRWQRDEFRFLYSLDTLTEYAEKLGGVLGRLQESISSRSVSRRWPP